MGMMVENSFDRWTKDVFFSAAEEVQESADILESVYRAWERERRDGFKSDDSEELCRELHIAIGTTKWQLEEFEKAVKNSHGNCSADNTNARHRQFVTVLENQISRIEKALRDSFIEEGKPPLPWVQLDEEERDDLAVFLSGTSHDTKNEGVGIRPSEGNVRGNQQRGNADLGVGAVRVGGAPKCLKGFKEIVTINKDSKYVVELAAKELPKTMDEIHIHGERLNEQRRTWSSPDIGAWKIVIADKDVQKKTPEVSTKAPGSAFNLCGLLKSVESPTKSRWSRTSFWKAKCEENLPLKQLLSYRDFRGITRFTQGLNLLNERSRSCFGICSEYSNTSRVWQHFGRIGGFQRQVQGSQYYLQFSRSLQVTLVLMLTIFLIVPFMVYAL
ncbi:uncharacterized protein LOC143879691 isoform X2 [Tasmannia lanceolata]|uniref:uncharacterized protein LOC143879691 isoform X2 n=1 Tax=Tasmannia lanceolata TaxID=3420 RepID=UPI0040634E8B